MRIAQARRAVISARLTLARNCFIHVLDADATGGDILGRLLREAGAQAMISITSKSFFAAMRRRRPDAVVIGTPDGIAVLRRFNRLRLGTPAFVLIDAPDMEMAIAAMKAGATDVIARSADGDRLLTILYEALRQDGTPRPGGRLEPRVLRQLTPRERDVLLLISDGKSNKEAGHNLGISPRTIEVHRARVMEKLGARNAADLMRIVLTG